MNVKGGFSFILLGSLSILLLSSSTLYGLMLTPSVARVETLGSNYLMPKALASEGEEQAAEEATQEEEEGEGEAPEQEEEEEEVPTPTSKPEASTGSESASTGTDTDTSPAGTTEAVESVLSTPDERANALQTLEQEGEIPAGTTEAVESVLSTPDERANALQTLEQEGEIPAGTTEAVESVLSGDKTALPQLCNAASGDLASGIDAADCASLGSDTGIGGSGGGAAGIVSDPDRTVSDPDVTTAANPVVVAIGGWLVGKIIDKVVDGMKDCSKDASGNCIPGQRPDESTGCTGNKC